ncbi:MAG: hypothetical protein WBJ40_06885, partial [Methanoculleus sp.]
AVTRGIPHEDEGSIFIQIPATPRNLSMDRPWTVHGEVYQTSVAVGLMASLPRSMKNGPPVCAVRRYLEP